MPTLEYLVQKSKHLVALGQLQHDLEESQFPWGMADKCEPGNGNHYWSHEFTCKHPCGLTFRAHVWLEKPRGYALRLDLDRVRRIAARLPEKVLQQFKAGLLRAADDWESSALEHEKIAQERRQHAAEFRESVESIYGECEASYTKGAKE